MADVVRTIGAAKNHANVKAWYDDWINTGNAFAGDHERGQVYGTVAETAQISFLTGNSSAAKTVILEAASGEEHEGKWTAGAAIVQLNTGAAAWSRHLKVEDEYIIIQDIQFEITETGNNNIYGLLFNSTVNGNKHVIRRTILKNSVSKLTLMLIFDNNGEATRPIECYRNILYDSDYYGLVLDAACTAVVIIEQNTIINCTRNYDGNDCLALLKQNYSGAGATYDYDDIANHTTSKNISSDATSPDVDNGTYTGKTDYTDYFNDYNNDDFTCKSDTTLKVGNSLHGDIAAINIDIEDVDIGDALGNGNYYVGADQYVAVGAVAPTAALYGPLIGPMGGPI